MGSLEEYKENQKEWRDISLNQLSNANNILLTFSSALLVFILDKSKDNKIYFNSEQNIDWNIFNYWTSVFILSLSILYGFCVLISRLYDARISRHIVLTRQRFFKEFQNQKDKELPRNSFGDFNFCDRIIVLKNLLFCKLPFIKIERISTGKEIVSDFQSLRRISKVLGTLTWKWTKIQFSLFLLSGLVYLIYSL